MTDVTITLSDGLEIRVSPDKAAELLVEHYGSAAHDQVIAGQRSAFAETWRLVDALLAARAGDDVPFQSSAGHGQLMEAGLRAHNERRPLDATAIRREIAP